MIYVNTKILTNIIYLISDISVPGGDHMQARENFSRPERDLPGCNVLCDIELNYVHCSVDVSGL